MPPMRNEPREFERNRIKNDVVRDVSRKNPAKHEDRKSEIGQFLSFSVNEQFGQLGEGLFSV